MTTWYIVKRGAMVVDNIFDTYEAAEMVALSMVALTAELWNVEKVIGWDR